MKKVIVFGLLAGATSIAFPQGHITLDNFENANNSPTASSNGKFFFFDGGCNPAYLANHDFNISFYGGSDANSLVLLKTFAGATAAGGNVLPGIFYDLTGTEVTIPGATTTAFFRIEAWTGSSPTFGGVNYGIDLGGQSPVFSNPVATVPQTPSGFINMPAIIIGRLSCISREVTLNIVGNSNQVTVSFPSRFGVTYMLQFKTNITDSTWQNILPTISGDNTTKSVSQSIISTSRFYRLSIQ